MTDLFDLTGRVAVVTGAGGRLGSAVARALHARGAHLVLTGRRPEPLNEVARELGGETLVLPADLTIEEDRKRLVAGVEEGPGRVDILVSNAGIAVDAPFGEVEGADFDRVLGVGVTALYLTIQGFLPLLSEGAKLVNIASIYGVAAPDDRIYEGSPGMVRASAPYLAAKGAVVQLTRELAVRLASRGIQVNCVSPGGIDAGQPSEFKTRYAARVPAGRMASPDDIVGAVIYFASPAASYTTGQNLVVDGGLTVW